MSAFNLKKPIRAVSWLFRCHAMQTSMALLVLMCCIPSYTQSSPPSSANSQQKLKPVAPVIVEPAQEQVAPPARTPEQMPPRPPQVLWDGKQLSIACENSTLSDILAAVRVRIGASIEIPPGAAAERVATKLGPAPAREVLASLLSNTDFDYVIQASDKDENGISSVLLTARGRTDNDIVADTHTGQGIRRMPGYPSGGRQPLNVSPESTSETATSREVISSADEVSRDTGAVREEPAVAATQTNLQAASDPVPADGGSNEGTAQVSSVPAVTANSGGELNPPSSTPVMVQSLQQMYEQRRQLQVQQNRPQNPGPTN